MIILSSCKTVQISDLRPYPKNSNLLPNLEPQIDSYSFQSAYSLGTTNTTGYGSGYSTGVSTGIISIGAYSGQSTAKADKRIQDAITLFERDVKDNICDYNSEKKGFIVCKIPVATSKGKSKVLILFPCLWTLGISAILGVPLYFYQTELEVEVEIFDNNKKSIARYSGYGKAKVPVAMYYGYYAPIMNETGNEGGIRKANIVALKLALSEIKQKIQTDNKMLIEKLNK
jgi:hypothetical protein